MCITPSNHEPATIVVICEYHGLDRLNRLDLGCGRNILGGWINLDSVALTGGDVVADVEQCVNGFAPVHTRTPI